MDQGSNHHRLELGRICIASTVPHIAVCRVEFEIGDKIKDEI